jgi:uncharacterized membrane protein
MKTNQILTIGGALWGFVYGIWSYLPLPERVPVHFDINGNPDRFGSKLEAGVALLSMPMMIVVLSLVLWWVAKNDTRVANKKMLKVSQISMVLLLLLVQFSIAQGMQAGRFDDGRWIGIGLGVLLIALGNLMPKIAPNAYAGLRLPWTLASDRAWYAANRVGGWLFVGGGLCMLSSLILPKVWFIWMLIGTCALLVLSLPYLWFYSKNVYQQDPDRRPL